MSWRETERDESHRVPLIVYRCTSCGKRAVSTNPWLTPSACCCSKRSGT